MTDKEVQEKLFPLECPFADCEWDYLNRLCDNLASTIDETVEIKWWHYQAHLLIDGKHFYATQSVNELSACLIMASGIFCRAMAGEFHKLNESCAK